VPLNGNTIIRQRTSHLCNGVYDYSSTCNIALDFVFIKLLDLGLYGAALATGIPISSSFYSLVLYI
jgi:Na+-driven multidrug efflux pump